MLLFLYSAGAGWLCYYRALQGGPAGVAVPIDKLSILVTIAFSWLVQGAADEESGPWPWGHRGGHAAAVGRPGGGIVGALCAGGFGGVIAAVLTADAAAACQQYSRQQGSGYAGKFFHGGCSFLFHGFSRVVSSYP